MPQYNPFNADHCAICTRILATIDEPIEVVKQCIECGFPLQEALDTLLAQKAMAAKVKSTFFPTSP